MTSFEVWVLLNVGQVGMFVVLFSVAFGIYQFVRLGIASDSSEGVTTKIATSVIRNLVIALMIAFAGAVIPDTKEALLIWGIPKIATVQSIDSLCDMPSKLIVLLDQYVDGAISSKNAKAALKGEGE